MTLKILFHMDVKCRTRKLEIPLGWVCCFPGHWTLQRKDSPRLPNAQPEAPFQRLRQVPERLLCCAIRETVVDRYRRMALAALVSLTAGIDPAKPSQELTGKLREADLQVTRLPPSAFPELPKSIRRELERRGCTIPQVWAEKKPQNVIKGEFTCKGQTDWAVLCSLNRVSTILIFRNASEQHPSELARESDIDKLQGVGGDAIGYSRAISPVGQQFILDQYRVYGGPKPPTIDHQGINDAFVEKASGVHYFHAGKWLQLTGAD